MKVFLLCILLYCTTASAQINLKEGLVAYYPFEGTANDMSGNNNNPIFNNTSFVPDRFGKKAAACYFNGKNNYIRIKNTPELSPEEFSLVAIIKPLGFYNGNCYNNAIIDKGYTDYQRGNYALRFTAGEYTNGDCSDPSLEHQNFVGMAYVNGGSTSKNLTVQLNNWYCVVYTFSRQNARLYVNGKLITSVTPTHTVGKNGDDLFLGKKNNNQFPYWFNGVMDEIRIYNRALNDAEVLTLCDKPVYDPVSLCIGENKVPAKFDYTISNCNTVTFELTAVKTKNLKSISWSFGDGANSNKLSPVHEYKKYGNFKIRAIVTSKMGCIDTFSRQIQLQELNTDFTFTEQNSPGEIQLKVKNNKATSSWNLGDETIVKGESIVTHEYKASGQYTATLFAKTSTGCTDTVQKEIRVILPELLTSTIPENEVITNEPVSENRQLEKRTRDLVQTIETETDSVSIALYDNGIIDGDSITLLFNNTIVLSNQLLKNKPLFIKLRIDTLRISNDLVMYADNLGSIPPNTALMIITDGDKRYHVNVSSTNSSNGVISFTPKR